jgi:hypothetical protein
MHLTSHYIVLNTVQNQRWAHPSSSLMRAWIISPEGDLYGCGQDHDECSERYPEILQGRPLYWLTRQGWGRIGSFHSDSTYIYANQLTEPMFRVFSELVSRLRLSPGETVQIITLKDTMVFDYRVFKKFESVHDIYSSYKHQ